MKKQILLIDDDEDEIEILNSALQRMQFDYECIWAQSAEHALQLLHRYTPDLIFLDYKMPKINGLRCLMEMKKIENLRKVPIVLYSTYIDEVNYHKAISLGATTCIQKPSTLNILIKKLQEMLRY